jgi:pimeloyl-ACP methyl ester carboxylesterase
MRFGLRREKRPANISVTEWREVLDARESVNSYRTVLREGEAWAESARQVRGSADLGAKPLLVLTGARDADAEWRALWVNGLQTDLTRLSSKGLQTILENSGHGIMLDAPNEVVEGVRTIWNEARAALNN